MDPMTPSRRSSSDRSPEHGLRASCFSFGAIVRTDLSVMRFESRTPIAFSSAASCGVTNTAALTSGPK
jgi:hypothetical protein